jgi:hypothetical protein
MKSPWVKASEISQRQSTRYFRRVPVHIPSGFISEREEIFVTERDGSSGNLIGCG